jgi:iron complex transport system ATP-binding protein
MGHLSARALAVSAGERRLFEDIALDVPAGTFLAVVGPNGVGKTTLLRVLAGVAKPSAGVVYLDGASTLTLTSQERARRLTLLAGEPQADGMSVRETVAVGRYAHHSWWDWRRDNDDAVAVAEALAQVELTDFSERPLSTLSSGERARASLALALAQGAHTLLLDEPTSHLDVRFAQEVLALLQTIVRRGATVVAVLHDLNEAAAYADSVLLLAPQRVVSHAEPRTALAPDALQAAYGIEFDAFDAAAGYRVLARYAPRS